MQNAVEVTKGDRPEATMEKVGEILNDTRNRVIDNNSSAKNTTLPSVYPEDSLLASIFKCLAYSLIVVFSVAGNSLVIAAFKLNVDRKLRTVNNMFIVSMAAGDLLLTVASTPERITRILADEQWIIDGNWGVFLCKTSNYLEKLFMNVSVIHLAMIAIDRFLVVYFPHKKIITATRARVIIAIAWLGSALYCVPLFYYANLLEEHGKIYCKTRQFFNNWRVWYLFFLSLIVLTLLFVVTLYAAIIIRLWCGKTTEIVQTPIKRRVSARVNRRVLKMVAMIVIAFYCCILPYWVGWVFCSYHRSELICNDTYVFVAIFLMYANSAVNPIIYAFFNDTFRVGFRFIMKTSRRCCFSSKNLSTDTAQDEFIGRNRSSRKSSEIPCQELKELNSKKHSCIYV